MPTVMEVVSGLFIATTLLLCVTRLIQQWSWTRWFMALMMIMVAVFFGDEIIIYAPKVFDFLIEYLWDFSLKLLVIIVVFVFFVQIIAMVKRVIFSGPSKRLFRCLHAHYVALAVEESRRFARFVVYSVNVIKITAIEFYAIEEDDDEDEIVEKVATMEKWGLIDSLYDWSMSFLAMGIVEFLVKLSCPFWGMFLVGWFFDYSKAAGAIKAAEAFNKDLSFGKAFRRVFDRVKVRAPWVANLWMIWINTVGIIWDGPDQVMYFYHKELNTIAKRRMFLASATVFQAAFWVWAYSKGLEEAGDFIKYAISLL